AQRRRGPDAARDPGLVQPGEAAADQPGGAAVAAPARAAGAEARPACQLAGVDRRAEDGAAVDVGARVELELGEEVAPVRRELLERLLPGLRERARRLRRLRGRGVGLD